MLPSIGMVLITSIYSIVDGFFVSNFAGKSGFAAVNLMFPAMMMLGSLGLMVGSGGGALVAKVKGEGYTEKANRIFTMLVRFTAQLGIVMGALFALFTPTIARWLGADEGMMQECVIYGRICMIGMPGFVLQMAFQSFYMAAGHHHVCCQWCSQHSPRRTFRMGPALGRGGCCGGYSGGSARWWSIPFDIFRLASPEPR